MNLSESFVSAKHLLALWMKKEIIIKWNISVHIIYQILISFIFNAEYGVKSMKKPTQLK